MSFAPSQLYLIMQKKSKRNNLTIKTFYISKIEITESLIS